MILDKCFWIELKAGCLIIGFLNMIDVIVKILVGIIFLATGLVIATVGEDKNMQTFNAALVLFAFFLIALFLFLAFIMVLLVGLHQNKRGFIKAYMIYTPIFLVLEVIVFFVMICSVTTSAFFIVYNLLNIPLNSYFLLVIRSYYIKMYDLSNRPVVYNTA